MKKVLLILLFLLVLPIALANTLCSDNLANVDWSSDLFLIKDYPLTTWNASIWKDSTPACAGGICTFTGDSATWGTGAWNTTSFGVTNTTIEIQYKYSGSPHNNKIFCGDIDGTCNSPAVMNSVDYANIQWYDGGYNDMGFAKGSVDTLYPVALYHNSQTAMEYYDNANSNFKNWSFTTSVAGYGFYIYQGTIGIDWILVYKGRDCPMNEAPAGDTTAPTISFIYPEQMTYNNYNGTLHFTASELSNCSVNSSWVLNSTNYTDIHYWNKDFASLSNGVHKLNVSCWDSLDNNASTVINFTIDTTKPGITTNLDSNNTVILFNLSVNVTATDNIKLYSLNVSNTEGFSNYTTQINSTNYIWNYVLDTSGYAGGVHYLNFTVCDAHTANKIEPYDSTKDKDNKKITFNFKDSYVSLEPKNKNSFNDVSIKKLEDRYSITFDKKDKTEEETFTLKSSEKIVIIGDDLYTGWVVIPELKKWVDFENTEKKKATIKRISDYEIEVTTAGYSFNSIGDLNCNTKIVEYLLYDYTLGYDAQETEITSSTFTLTITNTTAPFINYNNVSAYLVYNNTIYNGTSTGADPVILTVDLITPAISETSEDKLFYWTYSLNGTNVFNTTTQNQTLFKFIFDNCSTGNVSSTTFTIYKENDAATKLIAGFKIVMDYWVNSITEQNASFDLEGKHSYEFCIFPPGANISADIYVQYNTSNGFTHRYYAFNKSLPQTVENISLYNYDDTTGVSDLKGTVRDTNTYDVKSNILTKLLRYYPGENVYKIVQYDLSGDFGEIFFNIREQDTDYKMIFSDTSNNILRSTQVMKFVCTSAVCDLTFLMLDFAGTEDTADLDINYNYNNATGIITIDWVDNAAVTDSVRFIVTQETGKGTTYICNTTQTGVSGTVTCDISAYTGTILVRLFSTASPEMPKFLEWINKASASLGSLINKKEGALWGFGILLSIVGFGVVLGPIGVVVVTIFGLILISYLGIFNIITTALIIFAAIFGLVVALKVKNG